MKRITSLTVLFLVAILVAGPALAVTPADGVIGDNGELMSEVATLAGTGEFYLQNGDADKAAFRMPQSVLVLEDGTVLVSDNRNHLIRQIVGKKVRTFAGFESLPLGESGLPEGALIDGSATKSVFQHPAGLAADEDGNIYVADAGNHAIRKIATDGTVTTVAGDGMIGSRNSGGGRFYSPLDVAVAADGTIYVADTLNHLIRRIAPNGTVSTLNAKSERVVEVVDGVVYSAGDYQDGPLASALFNEPSGIAIDASGNLYVSDSGNNLIRYIDLEAGTVTTVAGIVPADGSMYANGQLYAEAGTADGHASEAGFNSPKGLAVAADGSIVIADSLNHAIRWLHNGEVKTLAGSKKREAGQVDGINGHNQLYYPTDVSIAPDGRIMIADAYNNSVRSLELFELPPRRVNDHEIRIVQDNEVIAMDTAPEIVDNRTMIPLRAVSESFAYEVNYDAASGQTVTISKDGTVVELEIGDKTMTARRADSVETTSLDVAPYISGDRTYVPLRFFSESFGLDVQWHAESRTVILRHISP